MGGAPDFSFLFDDNDFPGADSTTASITAPYPYDAGTYVLVLQALSPDTTVAASASVNVVVRAPLSTLLVDDDGIGSNQGGQAFSPEDSLFVSRLQAKSVAFDRFVMPYETDGGELLFGLIKSYTSVVWYTGDTWSPLFCFTSQNESVVSQWLNQGNRNLLLVSDGYLYEFDTDTWTTTSSTFVSSVLGGLGVAYEADPDFDVVHTFTGVSGQPTAGLSVKYGNSDYQVSYLNPKSATTTLFTETTPNSGMPVATQNKISNASNIVFSGFGFQEVLGPDAGGVSSQTLDALLDAAAIH